MDYFETGSQEIKTISPVKFLISVISFIFYIKSGVLQNKDVCINTNLMAPVFFQVYLDKRN